MPWRLIKFIIIFAIFLIFILFNYNNKCDISFGFFSIKDAPVFLTVFISFLAGLLCVFPFVFRQNKKKKDIQTGEKPNYNYGGDKKTGGKTRYYDTEITKGDSAENGIYGIN